MLTPTSASTVTWHFPVCPCLSSPSYRDSSHTGLVSTLMTDLVLTWLSSKTLFLNWVTSSTYLPGGHSLIYNTHHHSGPWLDPLLQLLWISGLSQSHSPPTPLLWVGWALLVFAGAEAAHCLRLCTSVPTGSSGTEMIILFPDLLPPTAYSFILSLCLKPAFH